MRRISSRIARDSGSDQAARAGVGRRAGRAEVAPARGRVAVEVHPARVLAAPERQAVGVEVRDEQQLEAARRLASLARRRADDRAARALVAVDAADDEDAAGARAVGERIRVTPIGRSWAERPIGWS